MGRASPDDARIVHVPGSRSPRSTIVAFSWAISMQATSSLDAPSIRAIAI